MFASRFRRSPAPAVVALLAMATPAPRPARALDPAAALLEIRDADPLELWRLARKIGDDAVVGLLEPSRPAGVRLAAARTAPYLLEPERALMPLCAMMTSRDSDLAPAAARAVLQIVRGLDPLTLARRELAPSMLAPALSALERIVREQTLRADIVLVAAASAAELRAASVAALPSP